MKIHEYQAKALLAQYHVPVPRGEVAFTVEQAEAAYARFVAGWNASGPKARTGAAKEERQ